jgi:hypothetical protein
MAAQDAAYILMSAARGGAAGNYIGQQELPDVTATAKAKALRM